MAYIDPEAPSTIPRLHGCSLVLSVIVAMLLVACLAGEFAVVLQPFSETLYANRSNLLLLIMMVAAVILVGPSSLLTILTHDPVRHYKGVAGKLVIPVFIIWVFVVRFVFSHMKEDVSAYGMKGTKLPRAVSDTILKHFSDFEWMLYVSTALSILCFAVIGGYYLVLRSKKYV